MNTVSLKKKQTLFSLLFQVKPIFYLQMKTPKDSNEKFPEVAGQLSAYSIQHLTC